MGRETLLVIAAVALAGIAYMFSAYHENAVCQYKDDLDFMYQEEKLARDVYSFLYERWGNRVFGNIMNSELRHMDEMEKYLESCGGVPDLGEGEFTIREMQDLYIELTLRGSRNLSEAVKVGILIEEKDISDLEERIMRTEDRNLKESYGFLLSGSENHLGAFVRQLGLMGIEYGPEPGGEVAGGN